MTVSRLDISRAALFAAALTVVVMLCAAGNAAAADLQDEAAWPRIFSSSFEAEVDPLGEATSCEVQYKTAAAFDESGWADADAIPCAPGTVGAAGPAQRVTAEILGLDSDTEYRYRFVATTTADVTEGSGGTFHTFGVEAFSIEAVDALGDPDDAAGSHPYELVTRIALPYGEVKGGAAPAALAKDILAELPAGLVGDPTAVEQCPARLAEEKKCSGDSQVGVLKIRSAGEQPNLFNPPIFNMTPAEGQAARLGGEINLSTNAYIGASVRTGADYGVTAGSLNLPTISNPFEFEIRIWGVPANPAHDPLRLCNNVRGCSVSPGTQEKAFLRNPTACGGTLQARVKVDSYNLPGTFFGRSFEMPAMTGCDELEFEPTLEVQPTSATADSPTGLDVDLQVPQNEDPDELATPDLREAVVKLPPGFTINPSSANGLEACTPAQIGLTSPVGVTPVHTTPDPAECPAAAKIGTVQVDTPLLDHPISGAVYVAAPYDNPFDSLLAIYIAAADPISGVVIKLAGEVEIGPGGQLTTTFADNPQLPFERFQLDFFGGDAAALKTPAVCGTYETTATLTPWSAPESGPPVSQVGDHAITQAADGGTCPTSVAGLPNVPSFEAGSESTLAGAYSPFVVRLSRPDGSQEITSLAVTPPPGLLGRLAGIPYCSDAALAAAAAKSGTEERNASSCPLASQVGSVVVGAGAGPKPYYTGGKAYLAGPYKGAPLSLAVVTPAVAGPYDLGDVVVRSALQVNPETAQITVMSDPIPTELKGIPLDVRSIAVRMDRPEFTLNPTNCNPMAVLAGAASVFGQLATFSERFQVGSCSSLGFKPELTMKLKGATKRSGHPALRAELTQPKSSRANIGKVSVTLPRAQFIDQDRIGQVCTRSQFAASACPSNSILGKATAYSPLLDKPLSGKVYLRANGGERELPDMVVALRGQIDINLVGYIDAVVSPKNKEISRIRTRFVVVPDAPVSKFVLQLNAGKKALLENSANLCRAKQTAVVKLAGQNGKAYDFNPLVKNDCGKKAKKR